MVRSKYYNISEKEMEFIGDLDKGLYDVLSRASNEELSKILHGGGYAIYETWGKVVQVMLKRVCTERNYDPWDRKPIKEEKAPLVRQCKVCGSTEDLVSYGLPDKFLCPEHRNRAVELFGWTEPLDED